MRADPCGEEPILSGKAEDLDAAHAGADPPGEDGGLCGRL